MEYKEANNLLGKRNTRRLKHKTYLERRDAITIAIRYWATDVVTLKQDGSVILNSGGFSTRTTSMRIREYSPDGFVFQRKGYLWWTRDHIEVYEFQDGMVIVNGVPDTLPRGVCELNRSLKRSFTIDRAIAYIASLDTDEILRLKKDKQIRSFVVSHCKIELVPLFIADDSLANIIERRLKNEKAGR